LIKVLRKQILSEQIGSYMQRSIHSAIDKSKFSAAYQSQFECRGLQKLYFERAIALVKIGRPTFWFTWVTSFIYPYMSSASNYHWELVIPNIAAICILEIAVCSHNEYVDRKEDAINQPSRTKMAELVGYNNLRRAYMVGFAVGVGFLLWNGLFINFYLVPLSLVAGFLMVSYNYGLHLKRIPYVAQATISLVHLFVFLGGWILGGDSIANVPNVLFVVIYAIFAFSIIKDLPDIHGDRAIGSTTLYSMISNWKKDLLSLIIYTSPFVLILSLVAIGVLEMKYINMIYLAPFAVCIVLLGRKADSLYQKIAIYHLTMFYMQLFLVSIFTIMIPSTISYMIGLLLLAGRIILVKLGMDVRLSEKELSIVGELIGLTKTILR
jgi:4-hydroxybenzoate polyprenyltransferase